MITPEAVLLGILFSSFATGIVIFFLKEESHRLRTGLNLLGAALKLVLVVELLRGVYQGERYEVAFNFLPGIQLVLGADAKSVLFVTLSAVLWFWTTLYAVGYLEDSHHRGRFFGFFSICVTATTGIALSANLMTFLVFYELLTISTYPLVVHQGTREAMRGGAIYLIYTLAGGAVLLLATVWFYHLAGSFPFQERGVIQTLMVEHRGELQTLFFLFMAGIGVKAAIVPLHSWLPRAMVAPAPVSALLHAVAVVKAGAFGVIRIVYDVFGVENAARLGVLEPLAVFAGVTIIYGSLMAIFQDELKKRLAFSTVSQVSYIILGAAIVGSASTMGGLIHLVHQGIMKITLFFCAGNYAKTLGTYRVSEMNGVGRRMPLTTAAFTIAALAMIGIPPLAGYVSKWYLQKGAIDAGDDWVVVVLGASSLLNGAYLLPILYRAWFLPEPAKWPDEHKFARGETLGLLLIAPLVTAALVVWAGLFAESDFSPLAWVKVIAAREYEP